MTINLGGGGTSNVFIGQISLLDSTVSMMARGGTGAGRDLFYDSGCIRRCQSADPLSRSPTVGAVSLSGATFCELASSGYGRVAICQNI